MGWYHTKWNKLILLSVVYRFWSYIILFCVVGIFFGAAATLCNITRIVIALDIK